MHGGTCLCYADGTARIRSTSAARRRCWKVSLRETSESLEGVCIMANRVGQQLGNYRLLRLLGRGGFAEVYLGEHSRLKIYAAIKVLHTSLEDDDVAGFLHEAQTVARLKHPHIVKVFDFKVEAHTLLFS